MKKEYLAVLIIGLFILAYFLEAVIDPLDMRMAHPYQFVNAKYLNQYPFTTAIILIRSLTVFLTPLVLFSFVKGNYFAKGVILLVLAGLMQLYALQDVVNNAEIVPLEWAIALAIGGAALIVAAIYYLFRGTLQSMQKSITKSIPPQPGANQSPEWLEENAQE